jgi:hypothetical protein
LQFGFERFQARDLALQLVRAEGQLGAAVVQVSCAALEIALERTAKSLTNPHGVSIERDCGAKNPPSGERPCSDRVLFFELMRIRLLVSVLTFFAVVLVLAAVPVLAQGSTPIPCTIKGTNGPDLLIGTAGRDVICGFNGNDTITAKGGNDIVRGGDGADVIYGDTGNDYLYGGPGNDRLYARDSARDHVYGGTGRDFARIDSPADLLYSVETAY